MWERFSFYGMGALVVLYMVQHLLLPGNIEKVVGMAGWQRLVEGLFGPQSPQGLASLTFGFYSALVYLTPLFGGWIADRWLGARRAVVTGALLMTAGHFAMAFERSFLLAVQLIVCGSGFLKGNIASQIGHLYPPEDTGQRTRAFTLFSAAINVGAVLGPLVCGLLAQLYGWHVGFGAAGIMMLVATCIYLSGQRYLPDPRPRRVARRALPPLGSAERKRVWLLLVVLGISIFHSISYDQILNAGPIWISRHADLATSLGTIPVPWFNAVDSFISILFAPLLVAFWAGQARRGSEPAEMGKIGIGAAIAAVFSGVAALGSWLAGDGLMPAWVPFLAWSGYGIAFLYYWPPLLGLVSRAAPARLNATLMGLAYGTFFFSGIIMGWIGSLFEPLGPVRFWLLNGAIAAIGALLVLLFGRAITRGLEGDGDAGAA
jgi:POT family proton-dependent oligopeptide transporter